MDQNGGLTFRRKTKSKVVPAPVPETKPKKQVRFPPKPVTKVDTFVGTPKTSPFLRKLEDETDAAYFFRKQEHKEHEHELRGQFVRDYTKSIGARTKVPTHIPTIEEMKTSISKAESSVGLKSARVWQARHTFMKNQDQLDKHAYVMESLFWHNKYLQPPPVPHTKPRFWQSKDKQPVAHEKPSLKNKIATIVRRR